jgi:hypothetical protein
VKTYHRIVAILSPDLNPLVTAADLSFLLPSFSICRLRMVVNLRGIFGHPKSCK